MTATLEALGIHKMTCDERIALIQAIWDTIAESSDQSTLNPAVCAELDRRLADHIANPHDVVPWEQVRDNALARLKK